VCHKKFNRKDNMTAHLRAVHGWGSNNSSAGSGSSGTSSSTTTSATPGTCLPQSDHQDLPPLVPSKLSQQVAIN